MATKTEKKERAILFSAPMAIAARNGTKTQTRRTLSKRLILSENADRFKFHGFDDECRALFEDLREGEIPWIEPLECPYGQPGDILWVREPYYAWGRWIQDGHTKTGKIKHKFVDISFTHKYTDNPPDIIEPNASRLLGWHKRLARFMLKAASRTKLEIVNVRVERLNTITMQDAAAEGIEIVGSGAAGLNVFKNYVPEKPNPALPLEGWYNEVNSFHSLWESINGPYSWYENPFVWVVAFKLLTE